MHLRICRSIGYDSGFDCVCADEAPTGVTLVPFAMRLLWAELPALVSPARSFESLDRLHYVERVCSQVRSTCV